MSTLTRHFEKLAKQQRRMEDEIHRTQEHGHIKSGQGEYMVNLSDEVHAVRQGIERTKLLLGVENERT